MNRIGEIDHLSRNERSLKQIIDNVIKWEPTETLMNYKKIAICLVDIFSSVDRYFIRSCEG